MRKYILIPFMAFSLLANAQQHKEPNGGGAHIHNSDNCLPESQRAIIKQELLTAQTALYAQGLLPKPKKTRSVPLSWPLQQAAGFDYCSYYGISNFVDHNQSYPNLLQDYNCGNRTYDLSSGYNHQGTDIFLWPFDWNMVNNNQVEVIAAASGTIIYKSDGNPHTNCNFSNPNWNAVYVQHLDGSVAWYGHMKNGSLTSKPVGASVVVGEKLGVVASSGSSTGPHLHFELYDVNNNLIDPYQGTCNNIPSWWATQKPYYESSVNVALTHSAGPVFNSCPNPATTNIEVNFQPGNNIVFAGYYHDQVSNSTATYTVTRPDNSIFATWNQTFNTFYAASYWYWTYNLPLNAPAGNWNFAITYQGQTCNRIFQVGGNFPLDLENISLQAMPAKGLNKIFWQTKGLPDVQMFDLERSEDGVKFEKLNTVVNSGLTEQVIHDYNPYPKTYYRVKVIYPDYATKYSKVVSVDQIDQHEINLFPNPAVNTVYFNQRVSGEIYELTGRKVLEFEDRTQVDIHALSNGIYCVRIGEKKVSLLVNR